MSSSPLPDFAHDWPKVMAAIIDQALSAGEVTPEDLRIIVLAPTQDRLQLGVWLGVEWENYPYAEDPARAAGLISAGSWLDQIDRLVMGSPGEGPSGFVPRTPVHFESPTLDRAFTGAWSRLRQALCGTAIELGTGLFAERFSHPVGIFVTMDGAEADLIAFCHPHGAPLLPLSERRKEHGFGSVYPQGVLVDDGWVVFYPEGQGTSKDTDAATIRHYHFGELATAHADDDEIMLRFRDEVFDVRLRAGHTHEERGGPNSAQVAAALRTHFEKSGCWIDPVLEQARLPADAAGLAARLEALSEDHERWSALEALAKAHGVAKLFELIEGCPVSPAVLARCFRNLARDSLRGGRPAEAMELLGRLGPKDRDPALEARAHLGLGQAAAALAKLSDEKSHQPTKAIALILLGRTAEAKALVEAETRDEDLLVARAIVWARIGAAGAEDALAEAFAEGEPEADLLRLAEAESTLKPMFAARRSHQEARAAALARLGELADLPLEGGAHFPERPTEGLAWVAELNRPAPEPEAPRKRKEKKGAEEAKVEAPAQIRAVRPSNQGHWAIDDRGGVRWIGDDGAQRVIATLPERPDALVEVPGGLVLSNAGQVILLSLDGQVIARDRPWFRASGPLAARGPLVAQGRSGISHGVDLLWAEGGLRSVATIGLPKDEHLNGLALEGERLYATTRQALYLFDVSRPEAPRPIARLPGRDNLELLGIAAGAIWLKDEVEVLVLSLSDRPTVLARGPLEAKAVSAWGANTALVSDRGKLQRIDLTRPAEVALELTFGSDGYPLEALSLVERGDALLAVTQEGLLRLEARPLDSPERIRSLEGEAQQVEEWLREESAKHLGPDAPPFGMLRLYWFDDRARVEAYPLVTLPSHHEEVWSAELTFSEAPGGEPGGDFDAQRQLNRALHYAANNQRAGQRAQVLSELLTRLGPEFAQKVATRRLMLIRYDQRGDGDVIVAVLPAAGSVEATRKADSARAPRSIRERLRDHRWYEERESLTLKAQRDPEVRREILAALAEEGLIAAARIAEALPGDEEVIEAWLAAMVLEPLLGVQGLYQHTAIPKVHGALSALIDHPTPEVALIARRALGRMDEDATTEILSRYLSALGTEDSGYDLPNESLAALPEPRLRQLAGVMRAAYDRMVAQHYGHQANELLVPLARAGVWLEETLEEAEREREMYSDLGGIFEDQGDQTPSLSALRIHTLDRLSSILRGPDDGGPLWPPELPPEKGRGGWQAFFELAWGPLEKEGLLEVLHQRLPSRAMAPSVKGKSGKNELPTDATFALQLLLQDILRGDPRAEVLGDTLKEAPYEGRALEDIRKLARLSRVQFGWTLLKARRFAEARRVADAALRDGPDDGQVMFFEARLAWLEADDPEQAKLRIPKALEKARDAEGRGRLYNLYGAALDAQSQYLESITWFEKALTADPSQTGMFLSNIAEAYWKAKAPDQARNFAEKARRAGSTTDIVKTILTETTPPEG
ncbi:MAG: hypothetical protein IPG45_35630 [Deltaproteobacteria bacterium]|nr:hypothetical protein [Deltaproteobacteria bacterium]